MQTKIAKFRYRGNELYFGDTIIGKILPIHPDDNATYRKYKIGDDFSNCSYTFLYRLHSLSECEMFLFDSEAKPIKFKTKEEAKRALKIFTKTLSKNDDWIRYTMNYELGD